MQSVVITQEKQMFINMVKSDRLCESIVLKGLLLVAASLLTLTLIMTSAYVYSDSDLRTTLTLMVTSTKVVKPSVITATNGPSQDYSYMNDQTARSNNALRIVIFFPVMQHFMSLGHYSCRFLNSLPPTLCSLFTMFGL